MSYSYDSSVASASGSATSSSTPSSTSASASGSSSSGSAQLHFDITKQGKVLLNGHEVREEGMFASGSHANVYYGALGRTGRLALIRFDRRDTMKSTCLFLEELCNEKRVGVAQTLFMGATPGTPNDLLAAQVYYRMDLKEVIIEGTGPGFSAKEALLATRDLASGLSFLHERKMVHRDIKPSSILLFRHRSGNRRCVIGGLLSVRGLRGEMSQVKQNGWQALDAPEPGDREEYKERHDVFSLGLVFMAIIANAAPLYVEAHRPGTTSMLALDWTNDMMDRCAPSTVHGRLIERMTALTPARRLQNGIEVATARGQGKGHQLTIRRFMKEGVSVCLVREHRREFEDDDRVLVEHAAGFQYWETVDDQRVKIEFVGASTLESVQETCAEQRREWAALRARRDYKLVSSSGNIDPVGFPHIVHWEVGRKVGIWPCRTLVPKKDPEFYQTAP